VPSVRLSSVDSRAFPVAAPRTRNDLPNQICLNNVVLQTLSGLNYYELLATCNKYNIDASYMSENIVKQTLWNVFSQTVDILI